MRIIYSDKQSLFETLSEKDGSVSVQNRNLQILATEMYKIKNGLSLVIVTELLEQSNEQQHDLRNNSIRIVYHGSESISLLGPKIWNILPDRLKNANSIEAFKVQIKKWPISALQGLYSKCRFCLREFL